MDKLSISEQNAINASGKIRSPAEKAKLYPKSAKLAIASFCYHNCQGEKSANSHTTKRAIKNCPATECPLWLHRGFQKISNGAAANNRAFKSAHKSILTRV